MTNPTTIEELTIERQTDEGEPMTRELAKEVLTRGAWTTIVYKYQDWDSKKEDWGDEKVRIERYRKLKGVYRSQSRFNISNAKQARKIINILSDWFGEEES